MNFPSLPTDNLYKFLAISGVVAVIAANWMMSEAAFRRQELLSALQQSTRDRVLKWNWDGVDRTMVEHSTHEARMESLKNWKPYLDQMVQIETEKMLKRVDEINHHANWQIGLLYVLMVLGLICGPAGFYLWWNRVQRYQDGILREEHRKAKEPIRPETTTPNGRKPQAVVDARAGRK